MPLQFANGGVGAFAGAASDAELASHENDTTSIHGITDTSQIALKNAANTFATGTQAITNAVTVGTTLGVTGVTTATGGVVGAVQSYLKPTAASYETFPRTFANGIGTPTDGRLYLVAIGLPAGITVSNISFFSHSTAVNTPENQWFALFDSSRVKLAISADDTSTAWAAHTIKTLAMTTPYAVTTAGLYYLGVMVKATVAVPTLAAFVDTAGSGSTSGAAPILRGFSTGSLTNPASCPSTAGAITDNAPNYFYAYVS